MKRKKASGQKRRSNPKQKSFLFQLFNLQWLFLAVIAIGVIYLVYLLNNSNLDTSSKAAEIQSNLAAPADKCKQLFTNTLNSLGIYNTEGEVSYVNGIRDNLIVTSYFGQDARPCTSWDPNNYPEPFIRTNSSEKWGFNLIKDGLCCIKTKTSDGKYNFDNFMKDFGIRIKNANIVKRADCRMGNGEIIPCGGNSYNTLTIPISCKFNSQNPIQEQTRQTDPYFPKKRILRIVCSDTTDNPACEYKSQNSNNEWVPSDQVQPPIGCFYPPTVIPTKKP